MVKTGLLVVGVVGGLQIIEELVHVQDHEQKQDIHCLSMHSLKVLDILFTEF